MAAVNSLYFALKPLVSHIQCDSAVPRGASFDSFFSRGDSNDTLSSLLNMCDDVIQMTTTLILVCFDLQLGHHFIEGAGIDTTDFLDTDAETLKFMFSNKRPDIFTAKQTNEQVT
jgi:hypothetical protein